MNSKKFAMTIEAMVKEKKIPYMDAVLKFCEDNDIDTASVGPLINKSLKSLSFFSRHFVVNCK